LLISVKTANNITTPTAIRNKIIDIIVNIYINSKLQHQWRRQRVVEAMSS
jgi:hypothetical protein